MFLEVSLPANIVQSPDLQKNGNGSFFTQGSSVLGSAEKKDQISEEDQSLPARPLVRIYSLSSHPCPSCLFSKSDSLLSHYTTRFHRRHSLSLDSLHFDQTPLFLLPLSSLRSSLQSRLFPPRHGMAPSGSLALQCCHGGPSWHRPLWVLPNTALLFHSCHSHRQQCKRKQCPKGCQVPSLSLPCYQASWPGAGRAGSNIKQPNVPPPPLLQPASTGGWQACLLWEMPSRLYKHVSVGHPLHRIELQLLWLKCHLKASSLWPWGWLCQGPLGTLTLGHPSRVTVWGKGGHILPGLLSPTTLLSLSLLWLSISLGDVWKCICT